MSVQGSSETTDERFIALETLRGLAAINVFVGHFFLAFAPHTHGLLFPTQPGGMVRSPLFALFNGSSAVIFFFLLSGFVLTIKSFRLQRFRPLIASALKRWPRLALPICVVSLLSATIAIAGCYANQTVAVMTESLWLANWRFSVPNASPNLPDALLEGGILTFLTGSAFYNASLWTMYYEFIGSFSAFALAAILIGFDRPGVGLLIISVCWFGLFFASPFLSPFIIGVGLAYAYSKGCVGWLASRLDCASAASRIAAFVVAILIVVLWGYCIPVGFYEPVGSLSPFNPLRTSVIVQSAAAALLLVSALVYNPLKRALVGRWGRLLGRLSFPIYLVHLPIICSLSSWLYLQLAVSIDRRVNVILVFIVTILAIIAISLPVAAIDLWWTRLLRRCGQRYFGG